MKKILVTLATLAVSAGIALTGVGMGLGMFVTARSIGSS
jgi:hypothetical protein